MTEPPIGPFLRSSSLETVIDTYLELLAQRMVALERAAGTKEIRLLRAENPRLRERLAEWESPPLEVLVTFLSAIFHNFWGQVRPEEMARSLVPSGQSVGAVVGGGSRADTAA